MLSTKPTKQINQRRETIATSMLARAPGLQPRAIREKLLTMALRTPTSDDTTLFRDENDLAGSVLWASVIYSLVPFLGIVFVPITVAICLYRILRTRDNSVKTLLLYLIATIVILFAQLGLWWLLYIVPALN